MVRYIAAVILILGLGACQSETSSEEIFVTQAANDNRVAKPLFEAVTTATAQTPQAIGGNSRGCQAGGIQLAETGPTWQAMRLSRNRNWGQPVLLDFVQDLSAFAATQPGWEGLYVGDLSLPRGGPVSGHVSHQSGIDADIWMLPPERLNLSVAERESISSISMRRAQGAFTNDNWTPQHEAILREAASDPRVARIFVFPGAKVAMCNSARGDRDWLRKIRPYWGHHYHFHVRLSCPDGDRYCASAQPSPGGGGFCSAQ